jgi:hypothetical protein
MLVRSHPTGTHRSWLFVIVALLAMATQAVVAAAPLLEGRDGRMASHVESGGAKGHLAHNDATCASCQARSIHGTVSRAEPPLLNEGLRVSIVVAAAGRIVSAQHAPTDNPRAPPV